jgi:predicted alpha/beta-hydrolase family hydrolase
VSHPRLSQALVLRVDAASNAALAAFLLAATWEALYEFFGLPLAEPPIYAQFLGAALVAFAIVEWALAGTPAERTVTLAAAVGNALAAAVLVVWLLVADTDLDTHGQIALWSVAAFLAVAAVVHTVVLSRGRGS